jgi:hypothetical protein
MTLSPLDCKQLYIFRNDPWSKGRCLHGIGSACRFYAQDLQHVSSKEK